MRNRPTIRCCVVLVTLATTAAPLVAHVTIRSATPLVPGGSATVSLSVPNERHVDTTRVVLEVPDDFLLAGGRISRLEFPPGWQVTLEKQDVPEDIYASEATARKAREAARAGAADHAATTADAAEAQREEAAMDALRRKWTKRVVFEGGVVPPDGWAEFRFNVQLPREAGRYRFPATQVYADGKEVGWTQLVEGAQRPAPVMTVEASATWTAYIWPAVSVIALITSLASLLLRRRAQPAGYSSVRVEGSTAAVARRS